HTTPRYAHASERPRAPRRCTAAPPHRQPTRRARTPSAVTDRRQPTATGAADPTDRSGQHDATGDDDGHRSRPRCRYLPTHQRARPSHPAPTEPTPQAPERGLRGQPCTTWRSYSETTSVERAQTRTQSSP